METDFYESNNETICLSGEFRCNDICIEEVLRCDTKPDCSDGLDEQNCESYICPSNHMKCENHFCIAIDRVCDFIDDCGDGSDEQNCTFRRCWYQEFKCTNGECVQGYRVCDGKLDCVDGSDESRCDEQEHFKDCGDGNRAHVSVWCDGYANCPKNHADELNCRNCTDDEFTCSNSRCIPRSSVCDTICDCAQNCEDEVNCQEFYHQVDGLKFCNTNVTFPCPWNGPCVTIDGLCNKIFNCPYDDNYPTPLDEYGCDINEEKCSTNENTFWCPEGRCISSNLRCNFIHECLNGEDELNCHPTPCDNEKHFKCANGQCIDQSKRCDSQIDCYDKSDELNCENYPCPENWARCASGQCILSTYWCDYTVDCLDGSDETFCDYRIKSSPCNPLTHYTCTNGQCISLNNRCLVTPDKRDSCSDGSHLIDCADYSCPSNSIKCSNSFCVHSALTCDHKIDCLRSWTDEESCSFTCSFKTPCPCIDIVMNCTNYGIDYIPDDIETGISRVIMKGNNLGPNLTQSTFNKLDKMVHIDLSNCLIQRIESGTFQNLGILKVLILSDNQLTELTNENIFTGLISLGTIIFNGNRIKSIAPFAFKGLSAINALDLGRQQLTTIKRNTFNGMRSLVTLDLSNNQLNYIEEGAFVGLVRLTSLDLTGNKFNEMGTQVFTGLPNLKKLTTDEFRFCCLARHVKNCLPEPDEFSSCEDLLSNIILRICIWILGVLSITGNCMVIFWRTSHRLRNSVSSFLIANLALGDLMMGVYLIIIGSVDFTYRGQYFIHDAYWRSSKMCQLAGFISTLSSELSVFTLTVITIDRFLRITFPLKFHRFKMTNARLVILGTWIFTVILAGVPLLDIKYFDNFYGRSGVCLSLHITNQRPNGWEYSVFVFLVLNFISFTTIAIAYVWMFIVAKNTRSALRSADIRLSSTMAKRIMLIVMTDFWCWMPIIALGVISLNGVKLPPQVFAWVAVFVLPLNAAMNPILYTISTLPIFKRAYSRSAQESKSSVVLKNGRSKSTIHRKSYHSKHHYFFNVDKNSGNPEVNCNLSSNENGNHFNSNQNSLSDKSNHLRNSSLDCNNNANHLNREIVLVGGEGSVGGVGGGGGVSVNVSVSLKRQQSSISSSSSLALTPLTPRLSRKSSRSIYFEPNNQLS
ncbi:G-protein coupled receptor GRL101-like [Panonychus citri]|uniref:G-protein coupled receptor GRL101-like n=1 Tax=Panonychus citri TaxID=50023 RepID=UPI0023076786|nr:G-protein coupled receptor GRL101-like [Panonychus citri]